MKKIALMFAFILSVLVPMSAQAQTVNAKWQGRSINDYYKYIGPDIDIQGGVGYTWDKSHENAFGMGRLRAGILGVPNYPWVVSVGLTSELNSHSTFIWGGQAEVMHLASGFWLRGGLGGDYLGRPSFNTALGYSLFGIELQGLGSGPTHNLDTMAVMATIRIPIGFLIYVFTKN